MADVTKKMVLGSMGVAGLVALVSIIDMFVGFPFSQSIMMDVMFLIGAGLVGYLGYDAYQDLA